MQFLVGKPYVYYAGCSLVQEMAGPFEHTVTTYTASVLEEQFLLLLGC